MKLYAQIIEMKCLAYGEIPCWRGQTNVCKIELQETFHLNVKDSSYNRYFKSSVASAMQYCCTVTEGV